jgi:acetyl-CoA acetyltransferase
MTNRSKLAQDVALVGMGVAGLQRDSGKSLGGLVLEACISAIKETGLAKEDIDGVGGVYSTDHATVWPGYVVNGLGLNRIHWSSSSAAPSMATVMDGIAAVGSGLCNYALIYHGKYRWDVSSGSARNDPLRQSPTLIFDPMLNSPLRRFLPGTNAIAAGMRRHMHEFGSKREHFGMICVNGRSNAQQNPRAIYHGQPMTLDDYMASPMVQTPFCLLDMDMPVDAASALVITTAERARDLKQPGVLVKDFICSLMEDCDHVFHPCGGHGGARYVIDALWERNGVGPQDLDYVSLYDGFSAICMDWIEATFGKRGDGPGILEDAFDPQTGQLKFLGRIPLNTHGGNLSEGRLQGMGQVLEAIAQLRGQAGERQVVGAKRALVTNAANPIGSGMILEAL